jgi:ABC-type lipoprotein release transport system permease subunit
MTSWKLAWRNLLGAGLRTWLNAFVLSLVFLAILTAQGLLRGMNEQTVRAMIAVECGGGQFWHPVYDPYDPLSLSDARGPLPPALERLVRAGQATPLLFVPGTIYPGGRMLPVVLKGIEPEQSVVELPTSVLAVKGDLLPALIGRRLAESSGLAEGDAVTLQWRDRNGTFDACDAHVVSVMSTPVQSVDSGSLWVPLNRLRQLTGLKGAATLLVMRRGVVGLAADVGAGRPGEAAWVHKDVDDLLADVRSLIRSKSLGSTFVYAILLFLALLAVFDAQIFSIFKRQREIGTLVALGMTRRDVVRLFALEGVLGGGLALLLSALYGVPLLQWFAKTGWQLPETTDRYGFALGEVLYPVFSFDVVVSTGLVVLVLTAIVSYLPTRRIARVEPTDALRGRVF